MEFDYSSPLTLEEALSTLAGLGVGARPLAGGTDIMLNLRHHALELKHLVGLKSIPGLSYVKGEDDGGLRIGGLTTLSSIEKSELVRRGFRVLSEAARTVGSVQIRNIATLAGNLCQSVKCPYYNLSHVSLFMSRSMADCWKRGGKVCHALKSDSLYHSILGKAVEGCIAPTPSDMAAPLMAVEAEVTALSTRGRRVIRLDEFYVGAGKTKLGADEIISEVYVPPSGSRVGFAFRKYSTSPRDVAVSNVAVKIGLDQSRKVCEESRIFIGGVAPAPMRATSAEHHIQGRRISEEVLAECSPKAFDDARTMGPKGLFKLRKTVAMLREALVEAFHTAQEAR